MFGKRALPAFTLTAVLAVGFSGPIREGLPESDDRIPRFPPAVESESPDPPPLTHRKRIVFQNVEDLPLGYVPSVRTVTTYRPRRDWPISTRRAA